MITQGKLKRLNLPSTRDRQAAAIAAKTLKAKLVESEQEQVTENGRSPAVKG